ncbi:hypothetical protein J5226_03940 [Lysobacter sp. K5869]|uniref:hypothetical protein n=1 Tax=Lysobacter sp. K5869 TaxID=2820808 RepID=UPI001C063969|nr:hypothetical protein [Lysobacter sp. K5869]QWP77569.1 hypothetical protein J5226_03940 [Lysobacter sp. K5869]
MPAIRTAALVLVALAAASAAQAHARYFELVNRGGDSIVAVAASKAGAADFADKPLGAPLRGGGESATIELPGPDCRYDLRFSLADGRVLEYADIDICRSRGLRVAAPPAARAVPDRAATKP